MLMLSRTHRYEAEVKKSRFIGVAGPASEPEEAMDFLEKIREDRATHNCWAYRIGELHRFTDDGEPGGTAGRPILAAIEGQDVDAVMVVVIRYFGGIKLGTGGLVRAYGGTAATCLREADKLEIVPRVTVQVIAPYDETGAIYAVIDQFGASKIDESFSPDGFVLRVELPAAELHEFSRTLSDVTRGKATLKDQ